MHVLNLHGAICSAVVVNSHSEVHKTGVVSPSALSSPNCQKVVTWILSHSTPTVTSRFTDFIRHVYASIGTSIVSSCCNSKPFIVVCFLCLWPNFHALSSPSLDCEFRFLDWAEFRFVFHADCLSSIYDCVLFLTMVLVCCIGLFVCISLDLPINIHKWILTLTPYHNRLHHLAFLSVEKQELCKLSHSKETVLH